LNRIVPRLSTSVNVRQRLNKYMAFASSFFRLISS